MTQTAAAEAFRPPEGLGDRGLRLWRDLNGSNVADASVRVLLEEACRTADRLERLDAVLRGDIDTWMELAHREDGTVIVQISSALAEARQQQTTLQRLVAAVQEKLEEAGRANRGPSIADQLAERRAAAGKPAATRRPATGRR